MKRNIFAFILATILILGAFSGCSSDRNAVNTGSVRPLKVFSSECDGLFLGDDGKLWGYGMNVIGNSGKAELTARQQQEIPPVITQYVTEEDDIPVIYNLHLLAENVKDFNFNGYLLILCEDGTLYDYEGRRLGTDSPEKLVPVYSSVAKLCGDSDYSFILEDGTVIATGKMTNDKEHYTACEGLSGQELYQFSEKAKMVYDNAYIDLKDNLWVCGFNSYGWHGNGKQDLIAIDEYLDSRMNPEYDTQKYHKVMSDVASFSCVSLALGVALKNDGSLWTWGSNEYGTIGNGEMGDGYPDVRESVTKPYKVLDSVVEAFPSRKNINIGFSYAEQTVVALTADGDVYAWGANREGLTGNGTVAEKGDNLLGSVAVPIKILSGVKDIAKIYGRTGGTFYALKENGDLYAWGNSVCGEVGNGVKMECFDRAKTDDNAYRVGTPALVATDIVYFDGFMAPYAIDKNGTVYAWGMAPFGYSGYAASRELEASIPGYGSNKMYLAKPVVHPQLSATIGADGTVSFVPTPTE